MNATLSFQLPDESEDHQAALNGPKWKDIAVILDQVLRDQLKHGHQFKTPDEALQATRDKLYEVMSEAGLALYT